jgi:hypothetical protein
MRAGDLDKYAFEITCDETNPWHAKLTEALARINDGVIRSPSIEQCKIVVNDQCPGAPEDTYSITEK